MVQATERKMKTALSELCDPVLELRNDGSWSEEPKTTFDGKVLDKDDVHNQS